MHTIHVLTPVAFNPEVNKALDHLQSNVLRLTYSHLDNGPVSIESDFDTALSCENTIIKARQAEKEGADALIVNCMREPGLKALRESLSIPVLGPCQTAMCYALMLGDKFSIIPTMPGGRYAYLNLARMYGLEQRLASVRPTNIPVREITSNPQTLSILSQCASDAVLKDGADVLILGCTHFGAMTTDLKFCLSQNGINVPIINPLPLTVACAESLIKSGLQHSKQVYPFPPVKS